MQPRSIAIDGPAGAGKSTVAKEVAERLNLLYVDTGAMYRAVTWYMMREGVQLDITATIIEQLPHVQVSLAIDDGIQRVFLNQEDVTDKIRTPEVSSNVSQVAQIPEVRHKLVEQQREIAKQQGVVMDGRDIGTYVLPDAGVKVFLTASLRERATRRMLDLRAKGYEVTIDQIEQDMARRDQMDSDREFAPLQKAEDAYTLDTTGKDIDQVIQEIINLYQQSTTISEGGQAAR